MRTRGVECDGAAYYSSKAARDCEWLARMSGKTNWEIHRM
jgi:hypothetical protein